MNHRRSRVPHARGVQRVCGTAPIFVIGAPFSGVNLLACSLAQNEQFLAVSDAQADALLETLESVPSAILPFLEEQFLARLQSIFPGANVGDDVVVAKASLDALSSLLRDALLGPGMRLRAVSGSPRYVPHVYVLSRLFPEARFIHVLRDVEPVVAATLTILRRPARSLCRLPPLQAAG